MSQIYKNISMHQYLKWDAVSASGLKLFAKSPMHYREYHEGRFRIDSAALTLGSALHALLESPDAFRNSYVRTPPKIDRRTKVGKDAFAAFQEEHEGKTVLSEDEWERIHGMQASLIREPKIRCWIENGLADREVSYRWTHPETGLSCKARTDWEFDGTVLDYKTCQDASPDGFAKAVRFWGYDLSAVHYHEGTKWERYGWVAVESKPPYAACLYWLQPDRRFRELAERRLEMLAEMNQYRERGDWPTYCNGESSLVV